MSDEEDARGRRFLIEERLAVSLSYLEPDPGELAQTHALVGAVHSWETVWTLADANGVAPLLHRALRRLGLAGAPPSAVANRFAARAAEVCAENDARLAGAAAVRADLAVAEVPVIVAKGALLAATVYRDPHYKRMTDLDLLVRREDVDAACRVYRAHGFVPASGRADD